MKTIARIVVDSDDFDVPFPLPENHSVMMWRCIETARAHPFSAAEVSYGMTLAGDQYFD